jgi:hypothetical protein
MLVAKQALPLQAALLGVLLSVLPGVLLMLGLLLLSGDFCALVLLKQPLATLLLLMHWAGVPRQLLCTLIALAKLC